MIQRGEIWWADLPDPVGSEPGYRRPLLIVSADTFNASRIRTVIGLMLTSSAHLAARPGNVALDRRETGLPKDSVANVSQLATVDKNALIERVGSVSMRAMERVDAGLRLALDL